LKAKKIKGENNKRNNNMEIKKFKEKRRAIQNNKIRTTKKVQ
jgi:hypothetical protein